MKRRKYEEPLWEKIALNGADVICSSSPSFTSVGLSGGSVQESDLPKNDNGEPVTIAN